MDDTVPLLKEIAAMGAKFALSPINPIGFIKECHANGILAGPSGMAVLYQTMLCDNIQGLTSNELWDMTRQGAKLLKLFHAGMVSPSILQWVGD